MLHPQDLTRLRRADPPHGHVLDETIAYFEGPIDPGGLGPVAAALCQAHVPDGMTWVLCGYGSSPRARYADLAGRPGVEVLWSAPILPWWMYPLALVAAAHGGLAHVKDATELPAAIETLATLAMVEAYLVPGSQVPDLVRYVQHRWRSFIGKVAETDPRYFCLGCDGDSSGPPTGCLAWISYGARCPAEIVDAVRPFTSVHDAT